MSDRIGPPALEIRGLNVHYGASHALQGVDLTLSRGITSVVGRNGMGKTTLCKAIMGLVPSSGAIRFHGQEISGQSPSQISRSGIGYVPQGRRLWRSLTVDEHLKLAAGTDKGAWSVARVYDTFPRLAERKNNGGGQLSGGEQQMLAIGRALLINPRLLVMDEPTEGLAPVIVSQVEEMLIHLGAETDIDVLVIEQNIGVACAVAEDVAIMVNGRVAQTVNAAALAADRDLQQRLLGVGRHGHDDTDMPGESADTSAQSRPTLPKIYLSNPTTPTRWSQPVPPRLLERQARTLSTTPRTQDTPLGAPHADLPAIGGTGERVVLVAGTVDTKGDELAYLRDLLRDAGLPARIADLSTSGRQSGADIPAHQLAAFHQRGASGVFTDDRGASVTGMALAFERWMRRQIDGGVRIEGIISAGGSGGTAMAAPAMRALPLGVPKLMVSTVASGDVAPYLGASDIVIMPAVADIAGLNVITRTVLGNAAASLIGMVEARRSAKPVPQNRTVALTMFGVTTPCVDAVRKTLQHDLECLVFHATGTGGRAMEAAVDAGLATGALDLTTTEVADRLFGGVFPAHEDRFGAFIRNPVPYVGSCGALDMVNFGTRDSVPSHYSGRRFYVHNPQVTLMRTTAQECTEIGQFIAARLNEMSGPVRFLIPEGGVSALDAPGQPFFDPGANDALFSAIRADLRETSQRRLITLPHHINDPEFAAAAVAAWHDVAGTSRNGRKRA